MRLLTIVSIIIFLPGILFASENYIVKLEPVYSARIKLYSDSSSSTSDDGLICLEDQCYMVVESQEEAEQLMAYGYAQSFEPDVMRYPSTNDPLFSEQWALSDASIAWNTGRAIADSIYIADDAGDTPVVAIIDTGYMPHEDINAVVYKALGVSKVVDSNIYDTIDYHGHGTHVAGIIAAINNNSLGMAGTAFDKVRIMPVKAYTDELAGFVSSDLIAAINLVLKEKAAGTNIVAVNMSYGGYQYSSYELDAMEKLRDAGIIAVTAAGNDGVETTSHYPSNYDVDNIISVGALASDLKLAYYSNYGPFVDIAAPGSSILSLSLGREGIEDGVATPNDENYITAWSIVDNALIFESDNAIEFSKSKNHVRLDHNRNDIAALDGNKVMMVKYELECEADCSIVLESAYLNSEQTKSVTYKQVYYTLETETGTVKTANGYLFAPLPEKDCWTTMYMYVKNAAKSKPKVKVSLHRAVGFETSNTYIKYSGTSMAAPFVSGIIGAGKALAPEVSYDKLIETLYSTADRPSNLNERIVQNRRINVGRFVDTLVEDNDSGGGGGCSVTGVDGGILDGLLLLLVPVAFLIRRSKLRLMFTMRP